MTENKDKHSGGGGGGSGADKEKDKKNDIETDSGHEKDKEQHDRNRRISLFTRNLLHPLMYQQQHQQPQQQQQQLQKQQQQQAAQAQAQQLCTLGEDLRENTFYRTVCASFQSAIILLDMDTGDISDFNERLHHKDEFGTQRVYKKTSANCVITLYLPTREITLAGNNPSILRGIVFVDPKAVQTYRVYAQLTLTFRYGREDEEVMGLRFCNEAIMSLHQVWPRNEEPARETLSPLQEALVKRLGDGAHPFTLTLTPQAPPSVQLVPAKRYYGAPIGTSYDVRCFIADKTDEKFHRRASVKMGVRVIYRTDVFHHSNGPENFAALINNQAASPPTTGVAPITSPTPLAPVTGTQTPQDQHKEHNGSSCNGSGGGGGGGGAVGGTAVHDSASAITTASEPSSSSGGGSSDKISANVKPRKSERGDSFPKLRLSPKSFRFSGRFGRSKSEIEKCPNDPFYNYSKSFQEYDSSIGGGPQGAVDKPFLLQDGRVGLRASLDKAWYTHGEDVCVTVNIRNDSRKTVRKVRVCAIQHVDVCMFNNGKFKNIVADSDLNSPSDRIVPPGDTFNATVVLKPQRGQTKNWIALEDTLQRCSEPEEITGAIAASAIRSPNLIFPLGQSPNPCPSPAVSIPHPASYMGHGVSGNVGDDRNVFAIYVSYYVKVKLTLSGMGGELSLKLPFVLVHVDENQRSAVGTATLHNETRVEKLALDDVPASRKNGNKNKMPTPATQGVATAAATATTSKADVEQRDYRIIKHALDRIESVDDEIRLQIPTTSGSINKRRLLLRSETLAKDFDEETEEQLKMKPTAKVGDSSSNKENHELIIASSTTEVEQVHVVQIHSHVPELLADNADEQQQHQQAPQQQKSKSEKEIVEAQLESSADEAIHTTENTNDDDGNANNV